MDSEAHSGKIMVYGGNRYEFNVNVNMLVLTQKPMGPVIKLVRIE